MSPTSPGSEASFVAGDWLARLSRNQVHARLADLRDGGLRLIEGAEEFLFGRHDTVMATVHVHSPRLYRRLLIDGSRGACGSFLDNDWSSDNLPGVVRVLSRNREVLTSLERLGGQLLSPWHRAKHWLRRNTVHGSRRNIADHYDLGNDFYALFLDPTMTYSSGIFEHANSSLKEASLAKYERACRKLDLRSTDQVIEIGSGWGGFAEYAARHYGCRVTTTTISREQFSYARRRIDAAGLSDRVTVLLRDYRELEGSYDKLVSIEMIEAVGRRFMQDYFAACCRLLKPNGMMLLQAITMPEDRYARGLRDVDFIKQHVFPGGELPSLSAITTSLSATDFRLIHSEDFGSHYARTLACWRERFWDQIEHVRQLELGERFIRMWDLYLAYCEGAFSERQIGVSQILFSRPECRCHPVLVPLSLH